MNTDPLPDTPARTTTRADGDRVSPPATRRAEAPTPTRRRLLTGAALVGATAAVGGAVAVGVHESHAPQTVSGVTVPTIAASRITKFGFTISNPAPDTMKQFTSDLDHVRDLGMGAVRFSAPVYESVADWGVKDGQFSGTITFNETYVTALADGVDEATKRGLAVCMMVIGVYPGDDVSDQTLVDIMRVYWGRLAEQLAPRAPLWQIFNEADGMNFRTGETFNPTERMDYVRWLSSTVGVAREAVHAATPNAQVTTNLYGYPIDEDIITRWETILDVLAPNLDVITLDAYPEQGSDTLARLVTFLGQLKERYDKEVVLGEIGVKTCAQCFTVKQQAEAYAAYLTRLQDSAASTVYFYALHEDEENFGVIDEHGKAKPAYELVQKLGED